MRDSAGIALLVVVLLASGCGEREAGSSADSPAAGSDSPGTLTRNLPPGRFELPTANSPAPNLWITLPPGFTVRNAGRFPDDLFFLVSSDDPSAQDTTQITPGFMRIYVGASPGDPFQEDSVRDGARVVVAGRPLQWREAEDALPDGRRYLKRELRSDDFFAALSQNLARLRLSLHVYVAGGDSAFVHELMKAAESVSVVP